MYTLAEKTKIIKLFKQGESIQSIRLHSSVSKSTLYRWRKQFEEAKEKSLQVKELIQQGDLKEAEKLAKEILEINSKDLPARSQLIAIYKHQGKWEEVERLAKERIKLEPKDLPARSQLVTIYVQQGDLKEAERLTKEILEINSKDLPARSQLIAIYKHQGKWEDVERLAKEILEIDPENLPARSQLIAIYKHQGKWEEAEKLTKKILEITPKDLRARRQLIAIYKKQGKWKEAEKLAKSATTSQTNTAAKSNMQKYRKQIYSGEVTLENLAEFEKQITKLTNFEQKMLLAEAYTHFNIAKKATQLLKEAAKSEEISDEEKRKLTNALQIAKSTKANSIQRRKQWGTLTGNSEER